MSGVGEQGVLVVDWVLAVDAVDPAELARVMRQVVESDGEVFGLLVGLASTVKAFAVEAHGDRWRDVLATSATILEVDDLAD